MTPRRGLLVLVVIGCLIGFPVHAQTPGDPAVLRVAHATRSDRLADLEASRREVALRFLAIADEIRILPDGSTRQRRELLAQGQELADRIEFLDEEIAVAAPAVRESRRGLILALEAAIASALRAAREADPQERSELEVRIRQLQGELARVQSMGGGDETPDPLASAAPALSALARVVADEHARVMNRRALQDELRLFLGNLRLFDDTGMPPSTRTDGGGDPDAGCPVSACPLTGFAPADAAMAHLRPGDDPNHPRAGAEALTLASLARLWKQLAARADLPGLPGEVLAAEARTITRETVVGAGVVTFRGVGQGAWGLGPKAGTSLFLSRPLGSGSLLTVEPSFGGRTVRVDPTTATEVAGEVRESLAGAPGVGGLRWQVLSWQKGRFLSDPLPLPGYLEPGRVEGGLASRLAVPLRGRWDLVLVGGGDVVRYAPHDWKVLDRQGLNASLGVARHGESGSGRLSLLGSRHAFPRPGFPWDRREDTRVGVEADGSFEGRLVARVTAGLAWNDSRLPRYDFRSARAALVLSAPWGSGFIQAYAALAHQTYLNPGPEGARVAPSDHDTGSVLAAQLNRPLGASRALILRAEWSRSESGFRNDFYHRFGTSIQMTFRDRE
jgi:hypothetical protein